MGWFDEQIRQRMKHDEEVFEDSFARVASSVLGGSEASWLHDRRLEARQALDEILKYYRYKPAEIPEEITDPEAQFDYALRPLGLMTRDVELTEGWYKDAASPTRTPAGGCGSRSGPPGGWTGRRCASTGPCP